MSIPTIDTVRPLREERRRLAGMLHDSVSQTLFSLTLHIRALHLAAQTDGPHTGVGLERALSDLQNLAKDALSEMRSVISDLWSAEARPGGTGETANESDSAQPHNGLVGKIRAHAAAVAAREGFQVRVRATEESLPLSAQAADEIFHIIREALHNCVKHAGFPLVEIRLTEPVGRTGMLIVEVADRGVSFDPVRPRPGCIGLTSMRERAARISGRLDIYSSPCAGTVVRIVLPGILQRPDTGRNTTEPSRGILSCSVTPSAGSTKVARRTTRG